MLYYSGYTRRIGGKGLTFSYLIFLKKRLYLFLAIHILSYEVYSIQPDTHQTSTKAAQ